MPIADYLEKGDLNAIKKRGVLRIVVPLNLGGDRFLPRKGTPVNKQHESAEAFARSQGLQPLLIPVQNFSDMIPMLIQGKGDLVAANLTVSKQRQKLIDFSVPLSHVREQVIVARNSAKIADLAGLEGLSFVLDPATTFWSTMKELKKKYPGILLNEQPPGLDDENVIDLVVQGKFNATVRDSNIAQMYLGYRDDIRVAVDVSKDRDIAWGIRKNSTKLKRALNDFMHREQLTQSTQETVFGDLDAIKKRKVLRILLYNNAASYFLWRGNLLGFEYELAKRFAKQQGLRLEVVVPPSHDDLIPWLTEGRADIAAGYLAKTLERSRKNISLSRRFHSAPERIVSRVDEKLENVQDLPGRKVVVRRSSSYWQSLQQLQKQGIQFELIAAPENLNTEEIIAKVAAREYDLTVSDEHILNIELASRQDIQAGAALGKPVSHHWATRKGDRKLLQALNAFFKKEYRGVFYNVVYKRYFKNQKKIRSRTKQRIAQGNGVLSPYDSHARRYAEKFQFDWRLIVSQMFQESRFDPNAKSWVGAKGLMQVMPKTAKQMGFVKLTDPEIGIHAGVRYMDWVRDRFENQLPVGERMWFTLAAYNAGVGHVRDARRLSRKMGWDPDRWSDNVERAMLLLSKPKYAKQARFGYVRGQEPVKYVREIRERYHAYLRLVEQSDSIRTSGQIQWHPVPADSPRIAELDER